MLADPVEELTGERTQLIYELTIETDPGLKALRRELIRALEIDIDTMRKLGNASKRALESIRGRP